ncbi:imidazolonepropionase-like domain-containing protein [Streptomyces sp. NPDC092296]|uniref:amidohydrolase family protein n=1 Tax=Streptomyces sp. NPDC092296 TaxID=3366012 RepID=UPI00382B21D9
MLTLHRADLVLPVAAPPLPDGAVAVRDDRIAAIGPYQELAAAHPEARTRVWHGVLTPGLRNPHGHRLLEHAYHPDPRDADRLGTEPVTGAALAALDPDAAAWGGSARRGLQLMLRHGTTAVAGPFERAAVRTAVSRSGLVPLPAPAADPGFDPRPGFDLLSGAPLAAAAHGPLAPGGRADLAVFDVPLPDGPPAADPAAAEALLRAAGAGCCIATVLAGRLVHRRR